MSEKHDVTKSSNPDVQSLLVVITGLASRVERLMAEVAAIRGELASLPQQYVVPGPNGEVPAGTIVVGGRADDPYSRFAAKVLGAGAPLVGGAGTGPVGAAGGIAGESATDESNGAEFEGRPGAL